MINHVINGKQVTSMERRNVLGDERWENPAAELTVV